MSAKSQYLSDELLKWVTGQTNALGTAATPYIGLFTALSADGETGTEASGDGYARVAGSGKFGTPSTVSGNKRRIANNAVIQFAQITSAVTIVGIGIWSASTGGNLLYSKTITSIALPANSEPKFAVGALTVDED